MDWISAALAGASAYFKGKSDKDAAKAATKDDYTWGSRMERYRTQLSDWESEIGKSRKRQGAAEFAKFSSLDQWAPGYRQTYTPPTVPTAPPQPQTY